LRTGLFFSSRGEPQTSRGLPHTIPAINQRPSEPGPRRSEYRPDIDGLRAIAVLAVIGYHASPSHVPGGFVGVDVFFVISGFLISGIILQSLHRGTFTFRQFYARRIRRIFPALSVLLAVLLVVGWLSLGQYEYMDLARNSSAGAGFVSNLLLWKQINYFDTGRLSKPLLHLWSLGIEEQYYAVWPLFLVVIWKYGRRLLPLCGIAIASFLLSAIYSATHPSAAFYSPASRMWELALGSMVAYVALIHGEPISLAARLSGRSAPSAQTLELRLREMAGWVGAAMISPGCHSD
jgi:peptidoglycan/LPS O-acetylase OafA/YrhL